jgi:hypothetical protein
MSSTTSASYGMKPQTVAAPPPGSNGSVYSNGKAISENRAETQNRTKFGGSKRSFRGGAGTVTVSPLQSTGMHEPGPITSSSNNIQATQNMVQGSENKTYDACVGQGPSCGQAGGSHQVPSWGCMSGGISRGISRGKRRTCRKRKRRGKTCRKRRGKTCRGRRRK